MHSNLLLVAAFGASVQCLAFDAPAPTYVSPQEIMAMPLPTPPPSKDELMRRLSTASLVTVLLGPDNTCGYISGLGGAAYYCGDTFSCDMIPGTAGSYGNLACCDTKICGVRETCINAVQYSSSSLCDNGCEKDTYTLKCTASTAPYCNSIRFASLLAEDYFCDSTSVSSWQLAFTTSNGEHDGRSFVTTSFDPSSTSSAASASNSAAVSTTSSVAEVPGHSGTASGSAVTVTAQGGGLGSNPSATPTPTSAPPPSSGSSAPIGAIVGGVVGGVAVIAAICALVWVICMRKRNKAKAAANGPNNGASPYPPQSNAHNSAYMAAAANGGMGKQPDMVQQEIKDNGPPFGNTNAGGYYNNHEIAQQQNTQPQGGYDPGYIPVGYNGNSNPQTFKTELEGSQPASQTMGSQPASPYSAHRVSDMTEAGVGGGRTSMVGSPNSSYSNPINGAHEVGGHQQPQQYMGNYHEMSAQSGPYSTNLHPGSYELGGR